VASEYDGVDGGTYDGAYDGVDALMAAITGEPLPEGARADASFLAEHRSARADVALLREQLGMIGEALAEPERHPGPRPVRAPRPPRPSGNRHPGLRALGLAALVTAAVAAVLAGMGWLIAQNGGVGDTGSGAKSSASRAGAAGSVPEYLACARLAVEGRVTGVRRVPDGTHERVTLAVDRYYKPASGADEITVLVDRDSDLGPRTGEHVLAAVPYHSAVPDLWTTGDTNIARERARILAALSAAPTTACGPQTSQ
jgi:hypothetical protein